MKHCLRMLPLMLVWTTLTHAPLAQAQKNTESPQQPAKVVAAPVADDFKRAMEDSTTRLNVAIASLRARATSAAQELVQVRKTSEDLELETALVNAILALQEQPMEKLQAFSDHFALFGNDLASLTQQTTAELESLKAESEKADAAFRELEKEVERLRAARLSGVWNDAMDAAFETYEREVSSQSRASDRVREVLEKKLELLNRQKTALDAVTPRLNELREVWNTELLKRQEALPLKAQVIQLWNGIASLPQRGLGWVAQIVQSPQTRKFVFARPGFFVSLLSILALILWGGPKLKTLCSSRLGRRQVDVETSGLRILFRFAHHVSSQLLFILLVLWIGLALQALELASTNAGRIILVTLTTLLVLRVLLRLNRSLFGAGTEEPLLPLQKDTARFYRRILRALTVYTVLGLLTLSIVQKLAFPATVSQLIRYLFDIGFIVGVHRLIHPVHLESLAGQLCPATWDWQRWTRWVRPARRMLMLFAGINVLVYLIGFQGLALFSATAMTVSMGLFFLWGVISLVGRLSIHFLLHAENGWLGRKLPERSELLERACNTVQRLFELAVTVWTAVALFSAWGIERSRLLGTLAWLKWEVPLGSVHLTPLSVILAVLVIYLGMLFSKLSTQLLGARIFPRTGWDIGVQYTISTILHYVVLMLSGLLALNIVGFPLGNLALIMGAVGVGVGLGLQNIVSNFFSGLILLIERPIKVGDLLVIDNQWGEVKEIRIRSTVFQTFDRSVLIIPNSDLTSGKILNWTHYGRGITRIKLQVGVSYDSDVRQVTQILRDICRENSRVMADPAPNISFSAYGESSLDFNIMVHVRTPDDRVPATHELNTAIFDAFKEHNIEIPFPQRDLYIKNWPQQLVGESVNR